ncbi:MAG: TfoX/Sxy family protein [Clostridia bacterium]|nr:TfoX/Sxy family protein [Clostridia bacterium]
MNKLSDMPNISGVIEEKLMDVGILSPAALIEAGSRDAFQRIRIKDPTVCFNMLCALEGAVRGIRWHYLDQEVKDELRTYFKTLRKA